MTKQGGTPLMDNLIKMRQSETIGYRCFLHVTSKVVADVIVNIDRVDFYLESSTSPDVVVRFGGAYSGVISCGKIPIAQFDKRMQGGSYTDSRYTIMNIMNGMTERSGISQHTEPILYIRDLLDLIHHTRALTVKEEAAVERGIKDSIKGRATPWGQVKAKLGL